MSETTYGKTEMGQVIYDLAFTDLTPKYLARKHGMTVEEIRRLRIKTKEAVFGKPKRRKRAAR